MNKLKNKRGVTLAEMLITVAIILILIAVAAIAVWNYQRSMHQLEFDGIAKEIFVAAQNHLTAAEGQGFLERGKRVSLGNKEDLTRGPEPEVFYFIVGQNPGSTSPDDDTMLLNLMLPFGAVDETVRLGGSYVVRYQKEPAQILDVFYSPRTGRFSHNYTADEYNGLINGYRGDDHKMDRRTYTDRSILGYYGGVDPVRIEKVNIDPPAFDLINAERLYVKLTNPNAVGGENEIQVKLIVTSKSGARKEIPVVGAAGNLVEPDSDGNYIIVFDDITAQDKNFFSQFGPDGFIPGEDIDVKAVAFSNKVFSNIAESGTKTANSLYADGSDVSGNMSTAEISNIRHLENLHPGISGVGSGSIKYNRAEQTADLSWSEFKKAINESSPDAVRIYMNGGVPGTEDTGDFVPVEPPSSFGYDGGGHSISEVTVKTAGNAGLFGKLYNGFVRDLELIDFDIESTAGNAGALAGETETPSSAISGILVRNTEANDPDLVIKGAENAGGLIGSSKGGGIFGCAAAVYVESNGAAGGLVGLLNQATVTGCYSGGHTKDGEYLTATAGDARVNVTGATAGGLAGEIIKSQIVNSYSTCSVSGSVAAGGFVGAATGTDESGVGNSYCTGLVTGDGTKGAFVGTSDELKLTNDHYFEIINEGMTPGAAEGVAALDESVETYNAFMFPENYRDGATTASPAYAYDDWLIYEFGGNTDVKTLDGLGVNVSGLPDFLRQDGSPDKAKHWGDWPSPETKVINEKDD